MSLAVAVLLATRDEHLNVRDRVADETPDPPARELALQGQLSDEGLGDHEGVGDFLRGEQGARA